MQNWAAFIFLKRLMLIWYTCIKVSYYNSQVEAVIRDLQSTAEGISPTEAKKRLQQYGHNRIKLKRKRSILYDIIEPFKSAFVLILIIAAAISIFLDKRLDAAVIAAIVVINSIIYYVQRITASRALKSLRQKDSHIVEVVRGNKNYRVQADTLVPGDIVILSEGSKVPADGRIVETTDLTVNESVLTGESLPVSKTAEAIEGGHPIYEQSNMVFQGTFVVSGISKFVVSGTGNSTEMAKIAKLSSDTQSLSPMQKKIDSMTSKIVIASISGAVLAFGLGIYRGFDPSEMLRFALSLTVAAVPEGLPIALTIILIFGVRRMAKKNALVRNLHAVETLGQTTLVATDKTGTITKNQLTIAHRWHPGNKTGELDEAAWLSLAIHGHHGVDPIEQVINSQLEQDKPNGWKRVKIIPFNQKLRVSGAVWKDGSKFLTYLKGAPEVVVDHSSLSTDQKKAVKQEIAQLSRDGHRLIGFASNVSQSPSMDELPKDLKFEGLIAFSDQMRPGIPESIKATHEAGIKVIMLTGDHIETARNFGQQAGIIDSNSSSAEGKLIEKLSLTQIRHLLGNVKVFGRVLPEHKYKILQAVERSEITAMTGDGVNDVPALVKADVGLAMGNGTDAAKEASDVVLLDNNYATIVEAIREGRTILANVRKMIFFLFSSTVGEIMIMVGALIAGLPLPLTAIQILWINLVTDGITVIPLGLEPPEEAHMKRAPEKIKGGLIKRKMAYRIGLTSAVMLFLTLGVFWVYLPLGLAAAQTMAFATLAAVQWANVLNARSDHASFLEGIKRPNFWLWGTILFSMTLQAFVYWGPLGQILGTVQLGLREVWVLVGVALIMLTFGDVFKRILNHKHLS